MKDFHLAAAAPRPGGGNFGGYFVVKKPEEKYGSEACGDQRVEHLDTET